MLMSWMKRAEAVTGQAEEFDPVKWEDLMEFQDKLLREEKQAEAVDTEETLKQIQQLENADLSGLTQEEKDELRNQVKKLKRSIFQLPEIPRPRFRLTGSSGIKYQSNVTGAAPRAGEKGDTIIDVQLSAFTFNLNHAFHPELDLSGKKTDLRFSTNGGAIFSFAPTNGFTQTWSLKFPKKEERDFWEFKAPFSASIPTFVKVNYRRKYFKKITHSAQITVTRTDRKGSVERDDDREQLDYQHSTSFNYAFSPKLSINLDNNFTKKNFTQEAFDQDSGWQFSIKPAFFYNFSPKTRMSLAYGRSMNRGRTDADNTDSRDLSIGYFGKLSKKSSASIEIAYTKQGPTDGSEDAKTYTVGAGYVWQATPKTQLSMQLRRQLQNTTSDLVSGDVDGSAVTTREDSYVINDNASISINSRLRDNIRWNATISMDHTQNKVNKEQGQDEDVETRQFNFPFKFEVQFLITRWLTLSLNYDFRYRHGSEKGDLLRDHIWAARINVSY